MVHRNTKAGRCIHHFFGKLSGRSGRHIQCCGNSTRRRRQCRSELCARSGTYHRAQHEEIRSGSNQEHRSGGYCQEVRTAIQEELDKRGIQIEFDVASNPEFLKEGNAVADFMSPDRVVVGVESERAKELMSKLYKPFLLNNFRVIFMDIPSAEMTKYAANSMLATRISFMNDIANLCELVGADVNMVRSGIGSDTRIGRKFLYPGIGYGGSCFPKDVKALIKTAEQNGYQMRVLQAVEEVNEQQKSILFEKLQRHFCSDLHNKTIALWGLAFKPETDDMREAPSLILIKQAAEHRL